MAKYNSVQGKLRKGGGKGLSGDALVGKVSQSTIDDIKRMGMTKALALAGKNGKTSGGMAREFQEGVRRMYGAKRLEAAKAKYAPSTAGKGRASAGMGGTTKPAPKPTKSNTKSNIIKGTLGTAAAVGVLAATKGKGLSAASKLAPAAVKSISKSAIGKALLGTGKKTVSPAVLAKAKAAAKAAPAKVTVGPKGSFGKTTLQQAKSGLGTASEYASKAGQASARASIKASGPDAARAAYKPLIKSGKSTKTFGEVSKNVAKATTKKKLTKAGVAASGAGQTGKK